MKKIKDEELLMNITGIIGLVIISILTLAGFAVNFASSILGNNNFIIFCSLIIYIFIVFYIIYHFNKPHGNLLKYLLIVFDLLVIASLGFYFEFYVVNDRNILAIITCFAMMLACVIIPYMAGKLDRKKANIYLIIGISVIFLLFAISSDILGLKKISDQSSISETFKIFEAISPWNLFIQWLAISFAYLSRYREHIEAGKATPRKTKRNKNSE